MTTVGPRPDTAPERTGEPADASEWHSLLERRSSRRGLLAGAAAAGVAVALPIPLRPAPAAAAKGARPGPGPFFSPIAPSKKDALVLPRGFRYDVLAAWGSPIGGGLTAGFNHDWVGYFPIDLLERGSDPSAPHRGFSPARASSRDGLLVINQEYVNPLFVSGYSGSGPKTPAQVAAEQAATGITVVRVRRGKRGRWVVVRDDAYARRIDATASLHLDGPAEDPVAAPREARGA